MSTKPSLSPVFSGSYSVQKAPRNQGTLYRAEKRRGHKKAIIAISRMLLTAIYAILKKTEPYYPSHYRAFDLSPANRSITPEQAMRLVRRLGYTIVTTQAS